MSGFEILALGLSAAGTAAETAGAYSQAKQQQAIAEANAKQASADALVTENRSRRSSRRNLAQATVDFASTGFTAASAGDVLADMAAEAEIEARQHRTEGEKQNQYYSLQADQAKRQASAALWSGGLKMAGTLATRGYDMWKGAA